MELIQAVKSFQLRVYSWCCGCFGHELSEDKVERNYRFLEEAAELVQACGMTEDEAISVIKYVFNRPLGNVNQEVGGVMITLAALCQAHSVDLFEEGEKELALICDHQIIHKIRAKQKSKPHRSSIPGI